MTIEQKRRELFEAWQGEKADKECYRRGPCVGMYKNPVMQNRWEGFNAALDSVVIDIRKDYFPGSDSMGAIVLDKNYSRFAFLRIIEDTGLGLKVKS